MKHFKKLQQKARKLKRSIFRHEYRKYWDAINLKIVSNKIKITLEKTNELGDPQRRRVKLGLKD